jgi:dTDP-glucose pyrophosphorylase
MSVRPTLVVLAAGIGSRYGGLKQIDPVGPGGEVVLDYSVFDALRAGFGRVVFIIRHDIETAFREAILSRYAGRVDAALAYQELDMLPPGFALPPERKKPWGTSHAVLCAAGQVHEPFAVINADDFYGEDSYRVLAKFLTAPVAAGPDEYALVGFRLRNTLSAHGTVARGVCSADASGFLTVAEELTAIEAVPGGRARNRNPDGTVRELTGDEPVSMNMWGFRPPVFEQIRGEFQTFLRENAASPKAEFYIPTAITGLIRKGTARCRILPTSSAWFGVTYREDKPGVVESVRALIRQGRYPERLWG